MSYSDYIIRRTVQSVPVLFGVSVIIFTLSRVVPGAPVKLALGQGATKEQVQQLRAEMGLNEPLWAQYIDWVQGVFVGDWGQSLRTGTPVFEDIVARFPATFELVTVAVFWAVLLAIPLGVVAAANRNKWKDHVSRVGAILGLSMPRFWVAILLQILFVGWLGLFPLTSRLSDGVQPPPHTTGLYLVDSLIALQFSTFVDAAWHLTLPAVALGLATLAQVMRLLRSDMIEEQREDYVMAARAYGLPQNLITYKYMLKNAFTSSLTIIGLTFGFLLGNAFLVEFVFSWPGMAAYGVNSILFQDFNAIVGVTIIIGFGFVVINLIVDFLYSWLDPRVRYGGGE